MEKKPDKKLDTIKLEIARELGLADKVLQFGWKSLTAKETGKIGGLVSKRKKTLQDISHVVE
jgi:hypothetical protein